MSGHDRFAGRRRGRAGPLVWALTLFLPWSLLGQARVLVEHQSEMRPVVAMEGELPLIEVGGRRQPVQTGRVSVVGAPRYTDGAVEILSRDAVMGQGYGPNYGGFFFRFDATVQAERDFEDCFVLFAITPQQGDPTYVLRELPDIDAGGAERIQLTIPVAPSFGGGTFGYMLFSRGEEIRKIDPAAAIGIRRSDATEGEGRRADPVERPPPGGGFSEPARALQTRLPDFPPSLVGVLGGGYVEAIYSVDQTGRAFEILDVKADHRELLPEAWASIVQTRYAPASVNGKPLVATVRQRFFFNEFASFPEEMVMISYPKLPDRQPQVVFAPLPAVSVGARLEFSVEVTVDTLGRPRDPEIVGPADASIAQATLAKVEEWLFLPGVSEGYPTEQTVKIPIFFNPAP